jgi:dephospho-CoA kinase
MGSRAKPVIGLLGGIGAGKSTVAAELVALGCAAIDGHELLATPAVREQLAARWGEGIFAGDGVNRGALAAVVFNDPAELDALNRILHPAIRSQIESRIEHYRQDDHVRAIVLDAAIMMEAGWDELCSDLVFVKSDDAARAQRVAAMRGWTMDAWARREKSQIPLDKKAARCNYVVDNSSSTSRLREQVREIFRRILHSADRSRNL